jgi:glyoxylase-like metal-dependent hydrolase (beta-lactamase superfamily II)
VLFYPRTTRTLVITDLCFNVHQADNAFARLFFRADGMWRRFGPSYAIRWLGVSDREAFRRSMERVLAWDVERILPSHGEPIERGGCDALRAAWGL